MLDTSKQRKKTLKLVKEASDRAFDLQTTSSKHINRYFAKRFTHIGGVRRFVAGWMLLVMVLIIATFGTTIQLRRAATAVAPAAGGTYTEGLVGSVNNLNPLFSNGAVDDSADRLIFNGLLKHDTSGTLAPDLAADWRVQDDQKTYTVDLKKNVKWQDGQAFTAKDVVYTIQTIQNASTRSGLFASWQKIKVSALNEYQVKFELPAPFAPFPNALTVAMLPAHVLQDIPADQLRTAAFNSQPIGTGPFVFTALRSLPNKQQQIELKANTSYFLGKPRLERFVLHAYNDDDSLVRALKSREITAAVDLKTQLVQSLEDNTALTEAAMPLNSGVFAFFKTTNPLLSDANVRTALAEAINREFVLKFFNTQYAPLKTPILPSQIGYDESASQQTNIEDAKAKLDAAGWKLQKNGIRAKDGTQFELGLTTAKSSEYSMVASELQKQWAAIGVSIKPQLLSAEQLQQTALNAHAYDILLYGVSIGYDPDVYAYWESSQARTGGLNFSEWKSNRADINLDTGRTRLDSVLRSARYKAFLNEWQKSTPAVALYQPSVSYDYYQNATGFVSFPATSTADRFANVETWTVNTRSVQKTP